MYFKIVEKESEFQSGDYLYQHDKKIEILLREEVDFSKLYFVVENSKNGLKLYTVFNSEKDARYVQLNELLDGLWWERRLTPNERKLLGMK